MGKIFLILKKFLGVLIDRIRKVEADAKKITKADVLKNLSARQRIFVALMMKFNFLIWMFYRAIQIFKKSTVTFHLTVRNLENTQQIICV